MAEKLEDFKVWHRANELWDAVNAIIDRPGFLRNRKLRDQILDASDSIVSNMAEGFSQPTDRAFAKFLYVSKASNAEVRTRLKSAWNRRCISEQEFDERDALGDQVARMLTGLIKYLLKSDRRDRGLGPRQPQTQKAPESRQQTTPTDDSTHDRD